MKKIGTKKGEAFKIINYVTTKNISIKVAGFNSIYGIDNDVWLH